MSVYLLATLDTKGSEAAFLQQLLIDSGVAVTLVDTGCLGTPAMPAGVSREQLFAAAGVELADIIAARDRGQAITIAAEGAAKLVRDHYTLGELSGVLSIGGSAGTTIGTAAMRALPLGVPKLMVSTLASGQVRQYVGDKDILMLNSIVDIAGLNRISRQVLANAAAAMAGMVAGRRDRDSDEVVADRPLIAATMFGVTTPCIEHARKVLEQAGYEVLVFHATGSGGQAMESLVAEGLIAGVLDITTTELADEIAGGFLTAGPTRLTAAASHGVPQVVSVGATDMANFHGPESVPERFRNRKFYQHNPSVTLMRTTVDENRRIGEDIGSKLSAARAPACILLPRRGVSAIDAKGQPFDDPTARQALFDGIRRTAGHTEIIELDLHINEAEFATAAASKLIELIQLDTKLRSLATS